MAVELAHSVKILKKDPHFAPLIRKHGPPDLSRYHGRIKVFPALLRSIIYQQLSGHAARAIHERFLMHFPRRKPTPKLLLGIRADALRAAGLSAQKITYMRDLAHKYIDGTVNERLFPKMTSAEIIEHLIHVKGIGEWTAHMLLIFTLHRPDILPTGDLAIRKGFQKIYRLRELPTKRKMEKLAAPWRQHATVASWYLWRSMDKE